VALWESSGLSREPMKCEDFTATPMADIPVWMNLYVRSDFWSLLFAPVDSGCHASGERRTDRRVMHCKVNDPTVRNVR